ncbi:hypothetical protein EVAR_37322_1 [Eumeta japonica]|uniref:Uncharacterized protein n=1 Tax=Eumeta variegata TaxID=151549 RepID=A0A4C1X1Q0_EUMVA|nr:hypothetical protein EVAR_37322_1 [Eumeta japonica]
MPSRRDVDVSPKRNDILKVSIFIIVCIKIPTAKRRHSSAQTSEDGRQLAGQRKIAEIKITTYLRPSSRPTLRFARLVHVDTSAKRDSLGAPTRPAQLASLLRIAAYAVSGDGANSHGPVRSRRSRERAEERHARAADGHERRKTTVTSESQRDPVNVELTGNVLLAVRTHRVRVRTK